MECETCPKIVGPHKTRFQAIEFDRRGWKAWEHYKECAAVDDFEKDEAVRKVALVCSEVQKTCEMYAATAQQWHGTKAVLAAVAASGIAIPGVRKG